MLEGLIFSLLLLAEQYQHRDSESLCVHLALTVLQPSEARNEMATEGFRPAYKGTCTSSACADAVRGMEIGHL